jgi:phosphoribosyl 1,2-cyclic phosphodiesterase
LQQVGIAAQDLDAIVVSHEHGDHMCGVAALARRFGLGVWSTPGTWRQAGADGIKALRLFSAHDGSLRIGDLRVIPFPVPHDAREPCQFVFESAGGRFGMLTDAGRITSHAREILRGCDALMLECNHDEGLLLAGPYPPSLRARVGGNYGHLSNRQAAEFLDGLHLPSLRHLLIAHISKKNNESRCILDTLRQVSGGLEGRVTLAEQERPGPWLAL